MQKPADEHIVTVGKRVGFDDYWLSDNALDRKPAALDLGGDSADDNATATVGSPTLRG